MRADFISAVQEDYLEAILALESECKRVRVRDIAARLEVHKSTVTAALKNLAEKGLVEYEPYGQIKMTRSGRHTAERVYATHTALKSFLTGILMVDHETAERNACRMEHVMDRDVLDNLVQFTDFMQANATTGGSTRLLDFKRHLAMEATA